MAVRIPVVRTEELKRFDVNQTINPDLGRIDKHLAGHTIVAMPVSKRREGTAFVYLQGEKARSLEEAFQQALDPSTAFSNCVPVSARVTQIELDYAQAEKLKKFLKRNDVNAEIHSGVFSTVNNLGAKLRLKNQY